MLELSEYQNDRAAAALNVDPADIRARKSEDGLYMVYAVSSIAVGFGATEALAVDALEVDARSMPDHKNPVAIEALVAFRGVRS